MKKFKQAILVIFHHFGLNRTKKLQNHKLHILAGKNFIKAIFIISDHMYLPVWISYSRSEPRFEPKNTRSDCAGERLKSDGPQINVSSPLQVESSCFMMKWASSWQNQQNDLCAQRRLGSAWASTQSDQSLHCLHEETLGPQLPIECTTKTDQTGWMPRLIWVFSGCTCHFVGFVTRCLKCVLEETVA